MRALSGTKAPELKADPIIHHPSVRTMLLTQKAVAEGGRSMVYECAKLVDKMDLCEAAGDAKGAKAIDERLAFLTPILKGFLTEVGKEAADLGIQAYGGHGYIKDNKAEQVFRDVRIAALWEGTTQIQVGEASTAFHGLPRPSTLFRIRIPSPSHSPPPPPPPPPWQALDLLGRKIMLQKLKPIGEHCAELRALCAPCDLGIPTRASLSHSLNFAYHDRGGFESRPDSHLLSGNAALRGHAWSLLGKTFEWQLTTYRCFSPFLSSRFLSSASPSERLSRLAGLRRARPPTKSGSATRASTT